MEVFMDHSSRSSNPVNHQMKKERSVHRKPEWQKSAIRTCGYWSEQLSSKGKIYFYNCMTEVSQWQKPPEWNLPEMNRRDLLRLLSERKHNEENNLKRPHATSETESGAVKGDRSLPPTEFKRTKFSYNSEVRRPSSSHLDTAVTNHAGDARYITEVLHGDGKSHVSRSGFFDSRYDLLKKTKQQHMPSRTSTTDDMEISPNSSPLSDGSSTKFPTERRISPQRSILENSSPSTFCFQRPKTCQLKGAEMTSGRDAVQKSEKSTLHQLVNAIRASIGDLLEQSPNSLSACTASKLSPSTNGMVYGSNRTSVTLGSNQGVQSQLSPSTISKGCKQSQIDDRLHPFSSFPSSNSRQLSADSPVAYSSSVEVQSRNYSVHKDTTHGTSQCLTNNKISQSAAEKGLVVPVYDGKGSVNANCENALRAIHNQNLQNGKLKQIWEKSSSGSSHPSNKTSSSLQQSRSADDEKIVSPYIPQCRPDRPDLYVARQCNEYDCFCVNVTTGVTLLGTRASPAEVGDCSTAVYSVLLALHLRRILPSSVVDEPRQSGLFKTGDSSMVLWDHDASLKLHIRKSIEGILRSAVGFQRVTNITRVSNKPNTQDLFGTSDFVYYQVELTSTGHSSLQAPQDLLEHRLHEGFLSDVGAVDPRMSYVKLIQPKIPDPAPVTPLHEVPSQDSEDFLNKQTIFHPTKSETPQSAAQPQSTGHKMVAVRSSELSEASYLGSQQLLGVKPLTSKSSGNAAHILGPFSASVMDPGASAVRQTSIQSRSLHRQSWTTGTSTSQILSQPGVIAGIVGSVVVVLLLLILLILFCIYRLRKKDEGSYALDEPKKLPAVNTYTRAPTREFYA
ncbi:unnamed protein product [Heterobilharzia americana]|nr:unnamed protein product [Heterobilharzia americana]